MELKQATKIVLKDILSNNQGGIPKEYLEHLDKNKFVEAMINSDYFLTELTGELEILVSDFIEKHGDEFDKEF